jgi:N-acetyl-gamma-glutamyl-phosphate reductase
MQAQFDVGIYGVTGYTGVELLKLMEHTAEYRIVLAQSKSAAGTRLGDAFPMLRKSADLRIVERGEVVPDIAFLCLPAGSSMKIAPELIASGCRVIDLSPDYRLPVDTYETTYGMKHLDAGYIEKSAYGLSELNRGRIAEASLVANPGCYATAVLLAIAPLSGLVRGTVYIDAKSGTSGSGREASSFNHHSEVAENIRPYNVNRHRHMPEIRSFLRSRGCDANIVFVPHLIPIVRGMLATIFIPSVSAEQAMSQLAQTYEESEFVHLVKIANLKSVIGTNHCLIQVESAERGCIIIVCIDNLLKGASGQALQNANIMLGLPEETGLRLLSAGVGI